MSFEEQLVDEINELRTNPQRYAQKVEKYIQYFTSDNCLKIPGSNSKIKTEEGAAAYEEAADYLSQMKKGVDPLEPSKGLARICVDFLNKANGIDPDEIRSINLESIIETYGSFGGSLNRAMDFGGEDPEQVVMNLLVCDGDPNRGNRESLLSKEFKKVGVANSEHKTYGYCTLIISCSQFTNNYDSDDYGFIDSNEVGQSPKKNLESSYKRAPEPYKRAPEPYKRAPEPYKRAPEPKKPMESSYRKQQDAYKPQPYKRPPEPYKRGPEPKKPTESYRRKPQEIEQVNDEEEDIPPEGVVSETRTEKIVMERGKKKRVIKIVRTMEDGSKETETIKDNVDD